ncbi:hypothetical protein CEE36_02880 [candidate division TA06 bacterium B3_TA06]|uniref:Uncharacterized protein n=1 Tax=candidate division TA06 bacterium B3_TA06 TaxID=2012487 RepID=A0A532V8V6_UNCT6|nr:MAG: hypothetical protein CEE36_02880 [candidate division TA06 bacterium B3_TA06]
MSNSKKLLIALAVILAVGATPLLAQLEGPWAGNGEGSCKTPTGITIYPWQEWDGFVENGAFDGSWWDGDNGGNFHGDIISISTPVPPAEPHDVAYCEGTWTWVNDEGEEISMGQFWMNFDLLYGTCEGEWWPCNRPEPWGPGIMWGWRIGD